MNDKVQNYYHARFVEIEQKSDTKQSVPITRLTYYAQDAK